MTPLPAPAPGAADRLVMAENRGNITRGSTPTSDSPPGIRYSLRYASASMWET